MQTCTELLHNFYLASNMRVALYDKGLRCIAADGPTTYSFCNAVHTSREGLARCFASDRAAFAKVAKSLSPYTYTCPFGVFEAILPIIRDGELYGYLFLGEAADSNASPAQHVQAALPFARAEVGEARLTALFEALPHYSAERLVALAALAALIADRLAAALPLERANGMGEEIKRYIARNYRKRITLAELSLYFHCSTVTLTESFRRAFGTTVMAHVLSVRMAAAEALLRDTALSVAAVAEQCGFESVAHFSKTFKRAHGMSPLHWRQHGAE